MMKWVEVDVVIRSVVLVEIEDDETISDALQYASDEYSNVDGDRTSSVRSKPTTEDAINSCKRHANKILKY